MVVVTQSVHLRTREGTSRLKSPGGDRVDDDDGDGTLDQD